MKKVNPDRVQFTGTNYAEVMRFYMPKISRTAINGASIMRLPIVVPVGDRDKIAKPGDFIVRTTTGFDVEHAQ